MLHPGVKIALQLVEAAGLSVVSVDVPRSGHVKVQVARSDNTTAMFVFAGSPSDKRAAQNNLCRLKRFARGDFNPITKRTKSCGQLKK
jgi:hypothetical protein